MTNWQPIATAPKDGTLILGFFPDGARATRRNDIVLMYFDVWRENVWIENLSSMRIAGAPTLWAEVSAPSNDQVQP